jgi:hypothetical protein
MKTLTTLLAAAVLATSAPAADFTVAIEEPIGPLGQLWLDHELRKHRLLRDTQEATRRAEALKRARDEQRRYLASNDDATDSYLRKRGEKTRSNDVRVAEWQLKQTLESIEQNSGKKKKQKSLKEEQLALAQALEKLSEPEVRKAIPIAPKQ